MEPVGCSGEPAAWPCAGVDLDEFVRGAGACERGVCVWDLDVAARDRTGQRLRQAHGADVVDGHAQLDAAGGVLQRAETGLAHHALEHHAAGHADLDAR